MFPGPTEAHALPFATTNYEAAEDGTLHAVLPSRCVYATGEQTCAIFVANSRATANQQNNIMALTSYPGRTAVAPVWPGSK